MDPIETSIPTEDGKQPERYIRTFESDLDVVQRGGTPGLAPLKTPHGEPAERLIEASPIIVTPDEEAKPVPLPESVPIPLAKKEAVPPPIETYADDFRQHLKETDASRLTVLAAEQDAGKEAAPEDLVQPAIPDTHGRWYIAGGAVLLVLGVLGAYFAFARYQSANAPVEVASTSVAPIFVDSTETVSGTGAALMQAIVQAVAKPIAANSVAELSSADATSSDPLFLSLGAPVPGILVRNITPGGSMAGIVHTTSGQSPFFILSVDLYSATFSGMLSWEGTMQRDLSALYPLYPVQTSSASTTATTTAGTAPATPVKTGFRDETVSNHDVRVYRDALGRSILLYGYWNQNTLVIARDAAAFSEILDRLATSRAK